MTLYYVQKLVYRINRDDAAKRRYVAERDVMLAEYRLTPEEIGAFRNDDIGLLYVMGVNGQLLMHFAAWRGFEWNRYISAMREGLSRYGAVRAGVYAAVDDGKGGAI